MAGFQTAGLMVSDHPVLYGTTLAISLVGSVAALSPGVISVPVALVEYVLNLADNAPPTVSNAPAMNAAEPAAAADRVVSDRVEMPVVEAPVVEALVEMPSVPAALPLRNMPIAPEAAQHSVAINLAKDGAATRPQQQLTAATQSDPAPAIAAVPAPQRDSPLAAPKRAEIAALPSENFIAAFQSIPNPSLAVAAERPDALQTDGAAVSNASALTPPAAKPDQGFADQPKVTLTPVAVAVAVAVAAPVSAETPSKPVSLPAASPALVQTQARAADSVIAPAPVTANLPATSRPLPVASSLQQAGAKPAPSAQPLRLISSPQLRKFDLARIHVPARTPSAALSPATAKSSQASKMRTAGVKDRVIEGVVFHPIMVSVAGSSPKRLDVRIGADLRPSIKVGDLLGLVSDRMDPASANRFASAASAEEYVSLAALRASGFNVTYNAGADSISITAAD